MSRSVRSVIGATAILILIGAGGGYAVARWGEKEASPAWRPDWDAVVRGSSCVSGEVRDVVREVANLLAPDRPSADDRTGEEPPANSDAIGFRGDLDATAATGQPPSGNPLADAVGNAQDFLASIGDEVPRLDDDGPGSGC